MIRKLLILFVMTILMASTANATIYFQYDEDSVTPGTVLPYNTSGGVEFCQTLCGGLGTRGYVTSGDSPVGTNHITWYIASSQDDAYTEIKNKDTFPINVALGSTYYLAYYIRFDRINGLDVWSEGNEIMSADKGFEFDGYGIRWMMSTGQWSCYPPNTDHRWSVWGGNPTEHLNNGSTSFEPDIEVDDTLPFNQNGYSVSNTPQLEYEKWYSVVMEIHANSTSYASGHTPDGRVRYWINGTLMCQYNNIWTVSAASGNQIAEMKLHGTIKQNEYNVDPHYRSYDEILVTDDINDVASYLAYDGSGGGGGEPDPPTITSATVDSTGQSITIVYSDNMVGAPSGGMDVDGSTAGNDIEIGGQSGSGMTFSYTIYGTVYQGDTVDLDYDGAGTLASDDSGLSLAAVSNVSVTNNSTVVYDVAPTVTSASIGSDGYTLTVNFSETVSGDGSSYFNVDGGYSGDNLTAGSQSGSGSSRTYTLSDVVYSGETVNLDYTGTTIVDSGSNPLATFSNMAVTNNSTVVNDIPTVSSVTVGTDGFTITVVFSETVSGDASSYFNLDGSHLGNDILLTNQSGTGATRTYEISGTVYQGEIVNLDYTGTVIVDSVSNQMATFSNKAVTNNSTVTNPGGGSSAYMGTVLLLP
jgi:hypothetical protein